MLRQQSRQLELLTLFRRESGAFVEIRCVEESGAEECAVLGTAGGEGEVAECWVWEGGVKGFVGGGNV